MEEKYKRNEDYQQRRKVNKIKYKWKGGGKYDEKRPRKTKRNKDTKNKISKNEQEKKEDAMKKIND